MEENNNHEEMNEQNQDLDSSGERALQQCQEEVLEWKDKCMRAAADLQNYSKRVERDRERWTTQITAEIILPFLNVLDDIDRALAQVSSTSAVTEATQQSWLDGFTLIQKNLYATLEQFGVKSITQYSTFDPELHEAIAQVPSAAHEPGTIIDVHRKGFMIGDRVLRPAQVTVSVAGTA